MNDEAPLNRYWICVEEPKGSGKLAIIREVRARTRNAAVMHAYEHWPEQGPFEAIEVHQPVKAPPDVADLFKPSAETSASQR